MPVPYMSNSLTVLRRLQLSQDTRSVYYCRCRRSQAVSTSSDVNKPRQFPLHPVVIDVGSGLCGRRGESAAVGAVD